MPEIPADRWWIVEFAINNRGPLIGAAKRQYPDTSDDVAGELLDQVALEAAAPHSDAWARGFPEDEYDNLHAALFSWLLKQLRWTIQTDRRKTARLAELDPTLVENIAAVDPIGDRTDLIAATTEYAALDENTKRFIGFRDNGLSRAAMKTKGFSVRQINNANVALQSAGRRLASFGPIPAILAFLRRHGGEGATAASGGGAAAGGAAVAGTAGSKIVAGCVASVLCVGVVGGGVAVVRSSDGDNKPAAAKKAAPAKKLFTPITPSKTAKKPSASADKKTRGRAKARHSNSRSSSSSSRATENEFGVEAGGAQSTPSSNSSGSSSSGSNSSSGSSPEFGVEAGE